MVAERSRAVEKIGRMIHELTRPDAACITIADLAVSGEDLLAEGIPQGCTDRQSAGDASGGSDGGAASERKGSAPPISA